MKTLEEIIGIDISKILLLDIGAMETSEPGRFEALYKNNLLKVIGFEANKDEYLKLKNTKNKKYLNYCLGDGNEGILYVTKFPGCTSLYEPNSKIINLFNSMGTESDLNFMVTEKRKVKTHRLEEIRGINKTDVIKIDTQGSELDILKGFGKRINEVLIIESEVEFIELYKNQPLFSDLQKFLKKNNFILHKFLDIEGRPFRPWVVNNNPSFPMSQLLSADAIFIKDFSKLEKFFDDDLLKASLLLHDIYNSYDLSFYFLKEYDRRKGLNTSFTYKNYVYSEKNINIKFMNLKLNLDRTIS